MIAKNVSQIVSRTSLSPKNLASTIPIGMEHLCCIFATKMMSLWLYWREKKKIDATLLNR